MLILTDNSQELSAAGLPYLIPLTASQLAQNIEPLVIVRWRPVFQLNIGHQPKIRIHS